MSGGTLVREARRRAGLTQEELARRAGTTQSAIARVERGRTEPSWRRIRELIRACGFELGITMYPVDDSDWSVASTNLGLSVDDRIRQNSAFGRLMREAREARERQDDRA